MDLSRFRQLATARYESNGAFLRRLKRRDVQQVDAAFHSAHEEVFQEISCLTCANCCRTTSPIFYPTDIGRAARALRMKAGDFVTKYLRIDEEGDHVLTTAPCPFLGADNYCSIYDDRPKACREYPHTHRKRMVQVTELTHRNTLVCPAVLEIIERVKVALGERP